MLANDAPTARPKLCRRTREALCDFVASGSDAAGFFASVYGLLIAFYQLFDLSLHPD